MRSLQTLTARLAFQADKKILHLEEEDHYRLDIPAYGKLNLPSFAMPRKERGFLLRLTASTLAIFLLLFSITNFPAYSKILKAEVTAFTETEAQNQVQESLALTDPTPLLVPEDQILPLNLELTSYDNRLIIPVLNVNSRIVEPTLGLEALVGNDWNVLEDQIRDSLLQGVVHYPGTADPSEKGNVFLTGHSSNVFWEKSLYNTVFARLPQMQVGDDIYLAHDQKNYHYKVVSKREVSPKDVSVLTQGDGHTLTLMTCTPVGTNLKRLIVTAERVEL